jgi:hypothetical protein
MLDFKSSKAVTLDLKSDLKQRGRDTGYIYLVDTGGTLVFITLSIVYESRNLCALPMHSQRRSGLLGALNTRLYGLFHRWPQDTEDTGI